MSSKEVFLLIYVDSFSTIFSKVLIPMSQDSAVTHYRWETQAQRVCFPNVHILVQSHIKIC